MAMESLLGALREITGGNGIMACKVSKKNPLQVKSDSDSSAVINKESLIVPKHVGSLSKGNTVYLMPCEDNTFFVLGKG